MVKTGQSPNLDYILQPVIRAYEEALTGTIGGVVEPAEANARIDAIANGDVKATTYADENGSFLLIGLEPGSYNVDVAATDGEYQLEKRDAEVSLGENTDLETIHLSTIEE